jgi:hypothetical protein
MLLPLSLRIELSLLKTIHNHQSLRTRLSLPSQKMALNHQSLKTELSLLSQKMELNHQRTTPSLPRMKPNSLLSQITTLSLLRMIQRMPSLRKNGSKPSI